MPTSRSTERPTGPNPLWRREGFSGSKDNSRYAEGGVMMYNSGDGRRIHHQRPRHRRTIRKRLLFPPKSEDEPDSRRQKTDTDDETCVNQDKTCRETQGFSKAEKGDDREACVEIQVVAAVQSIKGVSDSARAHKGDEKQDCDDFPMPDLSGDFQCGHIPARGTPQSNETTPDPPVLHRADVLSDVHESPDDSESSPMTAGCSVVGKESPCKSELIQLLSSDDDSLDHSRPRQLSQALTISRNAETNSSTSEGKDAVSKDNYKESINDVSPIERNDLNLPLGEARRVEPLSVVALGHSVQNIDGERVEHQVMKESVEEGDSDSARSAKVSRCTVAHLTDSEGKGADPKVIDGKSKNEIENIERNELNVPFGEARQVGLLSGSSLRHGLQNKDGLKDGHRVERKTMNKIAAAEGERDSAASGKVSRNAGTHSTASKGTSVDPKVDHGDSEIDIASVERNDLNVPFGETRHVGLLSVLTLGHGLQGMFVERAEGETSEKKQLTNKRQIDSTASSAGFVTAEEDHCTKDEIAHDERVAQSENESRIDSDESENAGVEGLDQRPKQYLDDLPEDNESNCSAKSIDNNSPSGIQEKEEPQNGSKDIISPMPTPRETYEMFAAPTSNGKFNGRGPFGNGTFCSIDETNVESRKMKLDQVLNGQPSHGNDVEVKEVKLDKCRKIKKSKNMRVYVRNKPGDPDSVLEENASTEENISATHPAVAASACTVTAGNGSMDDMYRASYANSKDPGIGEMRYRISKGVERSHNQGFKTRKEGSNGGTRKTSDDLAKSSTDNAHGTFQDAAGHSFPNVVDKQFCYNQYNMAIKESEPECFGFGPTQQRYEQNNSDYQYMLESSRSFLRANGKGDACVVEESPRPSPELLADIHDALRLILGEAYNPAVENPVEALAVCGTELLKNDAIRFDFTAFCEYLLHLDMMNQMNGYPYNGSGDMAFPPQMQFGNPHYPPAFSGQPPPCPWYPPDDAAFYFDGESIVSVGVNTDPTGDFILTLPEGHPDQRGLPDGVPVYVTNDLRALGML